MTTCASDINSELLDLKKELDKISEGIDISSASDPKKDQEQDQYPMKETVKEPMAKPAKVQEPKLALEQEKKSSLESIAPSFESQLMETLGLLPGDILVIEMPFEDPKRSDFFPFGKLQNFKPGHLAVWVGGDKPIAHAVTSGHYFPGLKLTKLWDSKGVIFRLHGRQDICKQAATIMKRWCAGKKNYSEAEFVKTYPKREWDEEFDFYHDRFKDIDVDTLVGPATPYSRDRADRALSTRIREKNAHVMSDEGLRRALKFTSRALLEGTISKGIRCTTAAIAAFQAAFLFDIVKQHKEKVSFKPYRNKSLLAYENFVLEKGWSDSPSGQLFKQCREQNNFEPMFTDVFNLDSKFALPKDIFERALVSPQWTVIGSFSIYQHEIILDKKPQGSVPKCEKAGHHVRESPKSA